MAQSKAETVDEYLEELPPDRREAIASLRKVILDNLPDGYEEVMQYGMIGYVIPLERYPVTYNRQPLGYVGLASQKSYMTLYLLAVYGDRETEQWFTEQFEASGKKLDMGKSCVRFRKLEDLPIDLVGEAIARTPVADFIEQYETARGLARS